MTIVMTIWLGAKPTGPTPLWKNLLVDLGNAGIITAVITVGVTNYGLGYVCHAIFCAVMFFNQRERLVDTNRLIKAFGLNGKLEGKPTNAHLNAILGEFHLLLHTKAPDGLREYCTRRNSAWYIAKTCAIAIAVGFVVAVSYIIKSPNLDPHWLGLVIWAILLVIYGVASWVVGTYWNVEFWEVTWNWIEHDSTVKNLRQEWLISSGFLAGNNKVNKGGE
jgi:uncharacterized membrane protein YciS (DUF1049 family)